MFKISLFFSFIDSLAGYIIKEKEIFISEIEKHWLFCLLASNVALKIFHWIGCICMKPFSFIDTVGF